MAAPTSELRARLGQTPGLSVKHTVVRLLQLYQYHQAVSIDELSFVNVATFFAHRDGLVSPGDLVVIADADKNTEVTAFMQSFDDYSSCDGAYPWMGAHNCQDSACEWIDGATRANTM